MANNDSIHVDQKRRQFLIAARGAGALGAVAVLFGKGVKVQAAPPQQVAEGEASRSGYHETEHIRKYYRSAGYW
jgi:hypothetical protein